MLIPLEDPEWALEDTGSGAQHDIAVSPDAVRAVDADVSWSDLVGAEVSREC